MAFENTITEKDLDSTSSNFVQTLRAEHEFDPDLAVDGLSDSLLSRLLGLFGAARKR
ncbi:MAG: hypothetical protein R3288_05085 [Woeseiaceae bacterium]|nr:hypothetical protein [Woeseiaceae bacterium]